MTKPYKNFRLGEEVGFNTYLVRKYMGATPSHRYIHAWVSETCLPRKGVYVGYRHKNIGYSTYSEDGSYWTTTGQILCALVAVDPRRNPVPVPFEDLVKKEG